MCPGICARAEEEVAGRQRDPAADLLRDLHARLMAVRRLDGAVERIGQPEAAGRRHLAGRQERPRRSRRGGAADRTLLERALDRRDRRKEPLRVRQRAGARPPRRVEQLADAARQPIGEDAVAGADDAARTVRVRRTHPGLHVVEVLLRDELARIELDVVARAVGERQPRRGLPVVLHEVSERRMVQREPRVALPRRRHIVGPRRVDARMDRRGDEVRPPEHRGRERLERRQRREDDARGEEQIPLRLVAQVIEVEAALQLVAARGPGERVGVLDARLAVEVDVRGALAHDDEVGQLERRLLEDRREIERPPRELHARFADQRRRDDRHEAGDDRLIARHVVARRARGRRRPAAAAEEVVGRGVEEVVAGRHGVLRRSDGGRA